MKCNMLLQKKELENPEDVKLYYVLNGLMRLRNVDIYVTGSNSKLLSPDVMTAFRGRGDQVQVFPLSFKEYYDFVGGDKSEVYFKDISERYIVKLPDVLTELTDDLCSSVGSLTNAKKIADTLESVKKSRCLPVQSQNIWNI